MLALSLARRAREMQRTIDRSRPTVLKAISNLGEYHAASGHFEVVGFTTVVVRYGPPAT